MRLIAALGLGLLLTACSSTYYSAMEKVGLEKRDILVDRVEDARDSQEEAQEQFASALEQFSALVKFDGGELEDIYERLSDEYESSVEAAEDVGERIDSIEKVAGDLFEEWRDELEEYSNASLRRDSERKLNETERQYDRLVSAMRRAESRMEPVLEALQDNVLYLKHNLNASAIGALQGELGSIRADVDRLIAEMNAAIAESDSFIATLK
jgi:DNA repair exonuclease SbcCD ATPase subunit